MCHLEARRIHKGTFRTTAVLQPMLAAPFLAIGIGGPLAILGGALALGVRHGIDWDHIAAITDITSTTSVAHTHVHAAEERTAGVGRTASQVPEGALAVAGYAHAPLPDSPTAGPHTPPANRLAGYARHHRVPLFLGTMYAMGHGSMVLALGLAAILFQQVLPDWVDPVMERVVGITLLLLSAYLFYSVFRYFRGGEFHLRSRWMVVFAGVGRARRWVTAKVSGHAPAHDHVHVSDQQYGARTAYGIGLIHGVGAETGTQVLIIATAVGAGSKGMSIATLLAFLVGLLLSNSLVTIASTTGFISAQRRQIIYVAVGIVAAVFSLVVGLIFMWQSADLLPGLDRYVSWIGGPS